MLRPFLLIPLCALAACAIPTSKSNVVVLTDSKIVVEDCKKLGDIDGSSTVGQVLLLDKARDAALARLKIRGAELGGTHVLTPVADIKWKGPGTEGQVYLCSPSRAPKQT
ncbi:hypothetical protein [Bosea sp. PAMC 26642]|uniref:hypothetical protein n=1 Tax=Bosea sp. (strain PAMC 26642) TaxID=1792307 RepID=UPI00076FEE6F|nr:hypothetical protein [Bosea sp. PAMC 26642]AMJ61924.1 hypothetical protein AXW83_17915 [Bosea sp. PAMC 26642]